MNRILKLALLAAFTLLLSACGQRGPLYLPEQAPNNEPVPEEQAQPSDVSLNEALTTTGEQ